LTRTQPPLYSSLLIKIVKQEAPNLRWLKSHLETVIWNIIPFDGARKTIDRTGLNRYKSDGVGCLLR
jgi:alpha,alpha-trehalase